MCDVVAVAGIVTLFGCVAATNRRSPGTECVYNLKIMYMHYASFVSENGVFVTELSTNSGGSKEYVASPDKLFMHFKAFCPDQPPLYVLKCPADYTRQVARQRELLRNTNLSYFLTVNIVREQPDWIISGTRNISPRQNSFVLFGSEPTVEWDSTQGLHRDKGVLLFSDGSVRVSGNRELVKIARESTNFSNRIVVP